MDNKKSTQTPLNNDNVETRCPFGPPEQSGKDTEHKDGIECGYQYEDNYDEDLVSSDKLVSSGPQHFWSLDHQSALDSQWIILLLRGPLEPLSLTDLCINILTVTRRWRGPAMTSSSLLMRGVGRTMTRIKRYTSLPRGARRNSTISLNGSLATSLLMSMTISFHIWLHLGYQCFEADDDDEDDRPLERPGSPRIARKERERVRDRNPQPTDYATYNYTLKDGTIVRGKRGVTFAGFIAPSQVPKGTPEASRMRGRRDPANPRFMMPELPLKTRLSIAQGQSAVERAARDTAVQPADSPWIRKRESAPSPPGDAPRRKKIKWGHIEILDYND
ncbi:hypothetical protein F5Y01DRAFT_24570 [Xylaria sp. FL0043]|nr:hypothetical protein F5Y01DRAFT_24570 [Xylaria sp. FL0043]